MTTVTYTGSGRAVLPDGSKHEPGTPIDVDAELADRLLGRDDFEAYERPSMDELREQVREAGLAEEVDMRYRDELEAALQEVDN